MLDHFRRLRLSSPYVQGHDVTLFQQAINARRAARGKPAIDVDGQYGPQTAFAFRDTARFLGALEDDIANGATPRMQRMIFHPESRTVQENARAKSRKAAVDKAAKEHGSTGAAGAVALALKLAHQSPHIIEDADTPNRDGGLIDQMQHEVGMQAQPWCGAAAHWFLKHGGGLDVTQEVRYCPYTEAHAKNGTGGFAKWIPAGRAGEAPAGSLVLYGGREAVHVGILVAKVTGHEVHCVEGNTSFGDGNQANGGALAERRRPIAGGFPVRGFAVPRWDS